MFYGHHSGWTCGPFGFSGPGGMFTQVLFWLLLAVIIYQLLRLLRRPAYHSRSNSAALDTLNQRLAEGAISQAEYDEIRKRLVS